MSQVNRSPMGAMGVRSPMGVRTASGVVTSTSIRLKIPGYAPRFTCFPSCGSEFTNSYRIYSFGFLGSSTVGYVLPRTQDGVVNIYEATIGSISMYRYAGASCGGIAELDFTLINYANVRHDTEAGTVNIRVGFQRATSSYSPLPVMFWGYFTGIASIDDLFGDHTDVLSKTDFPYTIVPDDSPLDTVGGAAVDRLSSVSRGIVTACGSDEVFPGYQNATTEPMTINLSRD